MKRIVYVFAVAAMALCAASCQKDKLSDSEVLRNGKNTLDVITVTFGAPTRVAVDGENLTPAFEINDEVFGWGEDGTKYAYTCTGVAENFATFTRTSEGAPSAVEGTCVNLVFAPGYDLEDILDKTLDVNLATQGETLPVVMHGSGEVDDEGTCKVTFVNDVAIVEIKDAVLPGAEENQEFTMSLEGSNTRLQMSLSESESLNCEANTPGTITDAVKVKADAQGKVSCRFAVPASGGQVNIKVKASGSKCYVFDFGEKTIAAGKYITAKDKEFVEDASAVAGTLPGEFSASESGKVRFAQGNLFWDGDSFEFEANQYSIGTWNAENHVGYFYWSKDAAKAVASSYDDSGAGAADVFFTEAEDFTVGGQTGFRSLTAAEWEYILSTRTNAADLLVEDVTVCGVEHCLVIAPDACIGEYEFDKAKTSYSTIEWEAAEAAGLVCLPPAGYREGTEVSDAGTAGFFWTATTTDAAKASNLGFKKSDN